MRWKSKTILDLPKLFWPSHNYFGPCPKSFVSVQNRFEPMFRRTRQNYPYILILCDLATFMNDCQISDLQQIQDFHCQDSTLQELKVAKFLKKQFWFVCHLHKTKRKNWSYIFLLWGQLFRSFFKNLKWEANQDCFRDFATFITISYK